MEHSLHPDPLDRLLQSVEHLTRRDHITVSDVVSAGGTQAGLPVLVLAAAVAVSPLSGVPLVSAICGVVIVLATLQLLLGTRGLWLPARVARISLPAARVSAAVRRLSPLARWLDARARQRWRVFHRNPVRTVLLLMCLCAGAMMPLLEFVPFSSSIVGLFVLLTAFGLMVRDGLVIALSLVPIIGLVSLLSKLVPLGVQVVI